MKIRIINLGEIIQPKLLEGVKSLSEKSAIPLQRINEILQEKDMVNAINQFKQGVFNPDREEKIFEIPEIDENESLFSSYMVDRLNKEASVKITPNDFLDAWHKMNPPLEEYKSLLDEAVKFNEQPDCKLYILSYTNSLDVADMQRNGILVDPNQPDSLNNIPFYASYAFHNNAPELLAVIVNSIRYQSSGNRDGLFYLKPNLDNIDIAWIYTQQNAAAASRFGTDTQTMLSACENLQINSVAWDRKNGMSLSDVLNLDVAPLKPKLDSTVSVFN